MKINITKEVYEGGALNHMFKYQGDWYGASNDQIWTIEENPISELYEVSEEYIYSRIPNLKGKLNQEDKTTVYINYATGEININKQHKHFGLIDHKARATRQANVKFDFIHYLMLHKNKVVKRTGITSVLFLLGMILHWIIFIPLAVYVAYNLFKLFAVRNGYQAGDVGPAIVIDPENSKIAALTDMSLGFGKFPIVRVMSITMPSKYNIKGQRLAVAGGFQNTHKYDHWNYYIPQPIVCATKDETLIKESFSRINSNEWIKLESELKKFDAIPLEGYYPIDVETTSWKGRDLNEIHWNNFGKEKANINPSDRERIKRNEEHQKRKEEMKEKNAEIKSSLKDIWRDTKNEIKKTWEEEGKIAEEKKRKINEKLGIKDKSKKDNN